jgi:hypothetical protein
VSNAKGRDQRVLSELRKKIEGNLGRIADCIDQISHELFENFKNTPEFEFYTVIVTFNSQKDIVTKANLKKSAALFFTTENLSRARFLPDLKEKFYEDFDIDGTQPFNLIDTMFKLKKWKDFMH